jgi:NAD(P)-dependent dehydrogenase (short-subunit alcohol dehydrogenase family)
MDISGKTAIVTGATSGIGLGVATALAEAGANVVMADIHKDAVEQAAHGLSGTNKRVMPVRIDVTQEQSVLDALAKAEHNFGKLNIACNNAGVPMHGTRMVDVPPATGIRDRCKHLGHHPRDPTLRLCHPQAGGRRACRQHRFGRRLSESPRHQPGAVFDEQYAALSFSEALEHELEGTNVGVSVLGPGPINTNIPRGARNRPDHMGGAQIPANEEAVLAERLATTGLDPKKVGERVVDAIRSKTFYALSAPFPPMSSGPGIAASRAP